MSASAMKEDEDLADARGLARSPGVGQFRLNPFRVLRLPADAPANQAVWKAEKTLARVRAGVALPEPDLAGWLPAADELEIQQAAQKMEEPLRRLHDQLLWFDLARDPHGTALRQALEAADANALSAYLAIDEAALLAGLPDPGEAPAEGERVSRAALEQRIEPWMAHRINQANLRLLLSFSWMHGVGPDLSTPPAAEAEAAVRLDWQREAGVVAIMNPHALLAADAAQGRGKAWPRVLPFGLSKWAALLGDPMFAEYVKHQIQRLGDDLVTADDEETVRNAVRTSLADLVVGELKLRMMNGRLDRVVELARVAAKSGFDASVWHLAFRPLRPLFRAELDELEVLIADSRPANVTDIGHYLRRVKALGESWKQLDQAGLLGLGEMVNDAVQRAFLRIRTLDNPGMHLEPIDQVLATATEIVASASMKERFTAYRARLKEYKDELCHFCAKRDATVKHCAAVSGKKETGRTRGYRSTTIHYKISSLPLARCETCAQIHGFIRKTSNEAFTISSLYVAAGVILFSPELFGKFSLGTVILLAGFGFLAWVLGAIVRGIATKRATPRGERPYSAYAIAAAYQRLRSQGFSDIKYDYRPDAWIRISERNESPHTGGGLGAAGGQIVWIIIIFAFFALRVCK